MDNSKITIQDIALKAGVSTATVSRAINNSGRISEETKARIRQIIEEVHYLPNMSAQSLKKQRSRIILMAVPDVKSPFFVSLFPVLQKLLAEKNYILTVVYTDNEEDKEKNIPELAASVSAGGIIFASLSDRPEIVDRLIRSGIPTVLVGPFCSYGLDRVRSDYAAKTYLATNHILQRGHRKIAFFGCLRSTTMGQVYYEGYRKALAEYGLEPDPAYVFETLDTSKDAYQIGKKIAQVSPLMTAVCCTSDIIASSLMVALRDAQIEQPGQVSVTGIDSSLYCNVSFPRLTSVTSSTFDFSETIVSILTERMEKADSGPVKDVLIPFRLVSRESVLRLEGKNN